MRNRIDIMVDLETLGTSTDATVFQVGAIAFDIETGEIIDTFNKVCNIEFEDLKVDGSTLQWWLKTNKELLHDLLNNQHSCTEKSMWQDFNRFLHLQQSKCFDLCLWGNGISFDVAMVKHNLMQNCGNYFIKYNKERDVRTILDLATTKLGMSERDFKNRSKLDTEIEHDALDDCKYQIRYVCDAYRVLTTK